MYVLKSELLQHKHHVLALRKKAFTVVLSLSSRAHTRRVPSKQQAKWWLRLNRNRALVVHALFLLYVRTMIPHRISIEPWTVTPCMQNALPAYIYTIHMYPHCVLLNPVMSFCWVCVCVSRKCYVCWRLPGPKCIPHKMHNQGLEIIQIHMYIFNYIFIYRLEHVQYSTVVVQSYICACMSSTGSTPSPL